MAFNFRKLLKPEQRRDLVRQAAMKFYCSLLTNQELASKADYFLSNCSRDGLGSGGAGSHYDGTMRHVILPLLLDRVAHAGTTMMCHYCETTHVGGSFTKEHPSRWCHGNGVPLGSRTERDQIVDARWSGRWVVVEFEDYVPRLVQWTTLEDVEAVDPEFKSRPAPRVKWAALFNYPEPEDCYEVTL